nr:hypothetical protein HHPHBPLO_00030 [Naegleria fowleri]
MFFSNKEIFNKLFFFFFFILKKKNVGKKKVQWKLSSFFNSNRIKYFLYFINKLFLYKKYFYYFYLRFNLYYLFTNLKIYFFSLLSLRYKINLNNIFLPFLNRSLFCNSNTKSVSTHNSINLKRFFLLLVNNLLIKVVFMMFKYLSLSYYNCKKKKNKITLLRSPHIDKKSREQFELKHFNIIVNELSIFSLYNNALLSNCFLFFIRNFKIVENLDLVSR